MWGVGGTLYNLEGGYNLGELNIKVNKKHDRYDAEICRGSALNRLETHQRPI